MPKARLLGLDVGDVRVGVAVGSTLPSHAEPLATLPRAGGLAEERILKLIEERTIDTVVVGLPLSPQGERNQQCSKIEKFCRRLQRRMTVRIEYIDEFGSSIEADEIQGARQRRSRSADDNSDAIAAAVILRRYIDDLSEGR